MIKKVISLILHTKNTKLIQVVHPADIAKMYDIYKDCMYMPTVEKYNKKIVSKLDHLTVRMFACTYRKKLSGVVVISFFEQNKIEILGIAVEKSVRRKVIGSHIIRSLIKCFNLNSVIAETDRDAVEFYRKNGFIITEFTENYDGETVVRYKCELVK